MDAGKKRGEEMKPVVAFVCEDNSAYSQMAEGFAREMFPALWEVYSAGRSPKDEVDPLAVKVMAYEDIDIRSYAPKGLEDLPRGVDILVCFGEQELAPDIPAVHQGLWAPFVLAPGDEASYVRARDDIRRRIVVLADKVRRRIL